MNNGLPDCVIVSSNRHNDIGPYCHRTFQTDPKKWGAVFPWEFPQGATREVEESFLREHFTDVEIHMQGGAGGEGRGFRFLKQIWLCIALFNAEHRLPAIEKWWWDQPMSKELLDDDESVRRMLSPDATLSNFAIDADTVNLYGEKFLFWAMRCIQLTTYNYTAEKREREHQKLNDPVNAAQEQTSQEIITQSPDNQLEVDLKQQIGAGPIEIRDAAQLPARPTQSSSADADPSKSIFGAEEAVKDVVDTVALTPTALGLQRKGTGAPAQAHVVHVQSRAPHNRLRSPPAFAWVGPPHTSLVAAEQLPRSYPDLHVQKSGRSRVDSFADGRGAAIPTGQHSPFVRRETLSFGLQSMPTAAPPTHGMVTYGGIDPRGLRRESCNDRQLSINPNSMVFVHKSLPPPGPPHPHPNQHMHGQHPHPSSHFQSFVEAQPLRDHTNERSFVRKVSEIRGPPGFGEPHPDCGDRRNRPPERGGRSRVSGSYRGRGSDRGSFGSGSMPSETAHQSHQRKFSKDFKRTYGSVQNMRGNMPENWKHMTGSGAQATPRSSRDGEADEDGSTGFGHHHRHGQQASTDVPKGSDIFERSSDPPHDQRAGPMHLPPPRAFSQLLGSYGSSVCNAHWIGSDCVEVDQLIFMNVPVEMSDADLQQYLHHQFVHVERLNRDYRKPSQVFVTLRSHTDARRVLELVREALTWPTGQGVRVEVPFRFWSGSLSTDASNTAGTDPSSHFQGGPKQKHPPHALAPWPSNDARLSLAAEPIITNPFPTPAFESQMRDMMESQTASQTGSDSVTPQEKAKKKYHKKTKSSKKLSSQPSAAQDGPTSSPNAPATTRSKSAGQPKPQADTDVKVMIDEVRDQPVESAKYVQQAEEQTAHAQSKVEVSAGTGLAGATPSSPLSDAADGEACVSSQAAAAPSSDRSVTGPQQREENASDPIESSSVRCPSSEVAWATTPSKSDVEQVDDSFHTASGSPDSRAAHPDLAANRSAEDCAGPPKAANNDSEHDDSVTIKQPSRNASTSSKKSSSKVKPVPDVSSKGMSTEMDPTDSVVLHPPGSLIFASEIPPPTPAFFTAPNTPAVLTTHDKSDALTTAASAQVSEPDSGTRPLVPDKADNQQAKADAVDKTVMGEMSDASERLDVKSIVAAIPAKESTPKKHEKSKGPAQTESLNPFGQKQQKKSKDKKGKAATKGRPGVDGQSPSTVAGDASGPAVSTVAAVKVDSAATCTSTHSGPSLSNKALKTKKPAQESKANGTAKASTASPSKPLLNRIQSQAEAQNKKSSGIGTVLGRLFGTGGLSAREQKGDGSVSASEDVVAETAIKSSSSPLETPADIAAKHGSSSVAQGGHQIEKDALAEATDSKTNEDSVEANEAKVTEVGQNEPFNQAEVDPVGLGISTASLGVSSGTDSPPKMPKKRRKKPKRKQHLNKDEDETGLSPQDKQTTPQAEASDGTTLLDMLLSVDMEQPTAETDSDTSSQTMGRDTPPEISPSAEAKLPRKLPPKPAGSKHLVEAKAPRWKKSRRTGSSGSKAQDAVSAGHTAEPDEPLSVGVEPRSRTLILKKGDHHFHMGNPKTPSQDSQSSSASDEEREEQAEASTAQQAIADAREPQGASRSSRALTVIESGESVYGFVANGRTFLPRGGQGPNGRQEYVPQDNRVTYRTGSEPHEGQERSDSGQDQRGSGWRRTILVLEDDHDGEEKFRCHWEEEEVEAPGN